MNKILIAGYGNNETRLFRKLEPFKNIITKSIKKNAELDPNLANKYDLIVLFGYRKIIKFKTLEKIKPKIINLHISYLPHCRGAHPNFWSFAENAPHGVTIHEVDAGIDTGKILYQKQVDLNILENSKKLTFSNTYKVLINLVEDLLVEKISFILENKYKSYEQIGKSSFHSQNDLPKEVKSWNQNVHATIKKYHSLQKKIMAKNLKILDEIEKTRKSNNINWMNIVRTSLKSSQKETLSLLQMINNDDNKISSLFKKFNNKKN